MKSIFLLFLLTFFIQNSLAMYEYQIHFTGYNDGYSKCVPSDSVVGPYYVFRLSADITGFPGEIEFQMKINDYISANCAIPNNGKQNITCTIDILKSPLNKLKLSSSYENYFGNYNWTIEGWENVYKNPILSTSCYPTYSYYFIPPNHYKHPFTIECHSKGYNQVTITGQFGKYGSSKDLDSSMELEVSPLVYVGRQNVGQVKCTLKSKKQFYAMNAELICIANNEMLNFSLYNTTVYDNKEKVTVFIEESENFFLKNCDFSSFLKINFVLLMVLLLL